MVLLVPVTLWTCPVLLRCLIPASWRSDAPPFKGQACKDSWTECSCRLLEVCRDHIIQYHEVIGGLIGPWGERAALFFNVVSLLGLAVVQIIACASDAYYLYNGMNKR